MNSFIFSTLILIFCVSTVYCQGFLVLGNNNEFEGKEPLKPNSLTSRRPYSPLPPMHLPPHFQNLGITLPPPPPPPLHFEQPNPLQLLQLGNIDARFFNFLSQIKPMLFPWLTKPTSTTSATSTTPTTTK